MSDTDTLCFEINTILIDTFVCDKELYDLMQKHITVVINMTIINKQMKHK